MIPRGYHVQKKSQFLYSHLEVQAIACRQHEVVVARHIFQPSEALHHAGDVSDAPGPDVEVLIELQQTNNEQNKAKNK